MRISTAKELLNVDNNYSPKELYENYVNIAKLQSSTEDIVLLSIAYMKLQKESYFLSWGVDTVFKVHSTLNNYFSSQESDYKKYVKRLKKELRKEIFEEIDAARSTKDLKLIIEDEISCELNNTAIELNEYLTNLDKQITIDQEYSLKNIFYPLYEYRRRIWLKKIYKTTFFKIELIVLGVMTLLANLIDFYKVYPRIHSFLSTNFPEATFISSEISYLVSKYFLDVTLGLIGAFIVIGIRKYIRLHPKRQFIPPNFSAESIQELVSKEADKIELSDKDLAESGAFFSMILIPIEPIFTAVVAFITTILSFALGKSFSEIKTDAKKNIWRKVKQGFRQTDNGVKRWFSMSKSIAYDATMQSIMKNCNKLSGHLLLFREKNKYRKAA